MQKYILILLTTSLLLSACSIGNKDNLFTQKQECEKYSEEMLAFGQERIGPEVFKIDEIFYSPKRNSCLFTALSSYGGGDIGSYTRKHLFDFLSKEYLEEELYYPCNRDDSSENLNACIERNDYEKNQIENKIQELK